MSGTAKERDLIRTACDPGEPREHRRRTSTGAALELDLVVECSGSTAAAASCSASSSTPAARACCSPTGQRCRGCGRHGGVWNNEDELRGPRAPASNAPAPPTPWSRCSTVPHRAIGISTPHSPRCTGDERPALDRRLPIMPTCAARARRCSSIILVSRPLASSGVERLARCLPGACRRRPSALHPQRLRDRHKHR